VTARVRKLIRTARASLRFAASRAVLLLAAVTVLLAVVRGGTRFFYCPMTHLASDASLCASTASTASTPSPDDETDDADAPAVRTSDCCQEKWRAAAPTASVPGGNGPIVAPAGLVALLSPPQLDIATSSAKVPFGLAQAVRAGPPPPSAGERRARLMVFHI
jgi:hypothetical protein